jgi:hypothetical protein
MFWQQPGTGIQQLVTGRDVTPNLRTHLAYPDAQVIHLHSLSLGCSCLSSLAYLYIPPFSRTKLRNEMGGQASLLNALLWVFRSQKVKMCFAHFIVQINSDLNCGMYIYPI